MEVTLVRFPLIRKEKQFIKLVVLIYVGPNRYRSVHSASVKRVCVMAPLCCACVVCMRLPTVRIPDMPSPLSEQQDSELII